MCDTEKKFLIQRKQKIVCFWLREKKYFGEKEKRMHRGRNHSSPPPNMNRSPLKGIMTLTLLVLTYFF